MSKDIYQSWNLVVAGKPQEALKILDAILLIDGNDAEACLLKGNLLKDVGRAEDALTYLLKAKALLPYNARPDMALARLYKDAYKHDEEMKYLQSAAGKSLSYDMKAAQGMVAFYQKRYQDAEQCFLTAAALSTVGDTLPSVDSVWDMHMAGLCTYYGGHFARAERHFEKSAAADTPYKNDALFYLSRAKLFLRKYEEARPGFLHIIAATPEHEVTQVLVDSYVSLTIIERRTFHFFRAWRYHRKVVHTLFLLRKRESGSKSMKLLSSRG